MRAHTSETQATVTPAKALQFLKEGNQRFQHNLKANRNLLQQVNETSEGQFPFAVILSCIDSRTSAELIFDQGLGDIFSVRIAGNFINDDILGSLEFACKVAGSKLILVLGHTHCGAVNAACAGTAPGYIGKMLHKVHPAVQLAKEEGKVDPSSEAFPDYVSELNVKMNAENIRKASPDLVQMESDGSIAIVSAMYNVGDGVVTFYS